MRPPPALPPSDEKVGCPGPGSPSLSQALRVSIQDWINALLTALGEPPISRRLSLSSTSTIGAVCETLWHTLPLRGEPPMTRFIAAELAKDHWFNLDAARRDQPHFPRLRSGHHLFQQPSPQKQIPSMNAVF